MSTFDDDRPEGYDPKDDEKYPYVRHEDLKKGEKLAMDAEDVEEFVEHYGQEGEPLEGEQGAP